MLNFQSEKILISFLLIVVYYLMNISVKLCELQASMTGTMFKNQNMQGFKYWAQFDFGLLYQLQNQGKFVKKLSNLGLFGQSVSVSIIYWVKQRNVVCI